jgi:hypothetical protein
MANRFSGTKNYLYLGSLGTEVTTGSLSGEKFFKITAKGASSAFPADSVANDVVYNKPAITLASGDKAKPIELTKLGFVTNVPQSASKEKYENTVQTDVAKSYEEGDSRNFGTIDGYFTDDANADHILKRFFRLSMTTAPGRNNQPIETAFCISSLGAGNNHVGQVSQEYMPAIIDSLTVDKPMNGPQTFNFAYT